MVWNLPNQYETQRPVISKKVTEGSLKEQKRIYRTGSKALSSGAALKGKLENPGAGNVELISETDLNNAMVTTERISRSHVRLKVSFPNLQFEEKLMSDGMTYQSVRIPGTSTKSLGEGMPTLPVKPLMVRIPNGRNFEVFHSTGESFTFEGVNLASEQAPFHPDKPVKAFAKHQPFIKRYAIPGSGFLQCRASKYASQRVCSGYGYTCTIQPQSQELVVTSTVEVDVKVDEFMDNDQDVSALYSRAFEEMASDGDFAFVKASSTTDDSSTVEAAFAETLRPPVSIYRLYRSCLLVTSSKNIWLFTMTNLRRILHLKPSLNGKDRKAITSFRLKPVR